MAGKSASLEADLLELLFNGTTITGLADNTVTSPVGTLYVSLHTADPLESDDQTTSETSYTNYARQGVTRNGSNWLVSVTEGRVYPAADIDFPTCSGASGDTITHWGIGTAASSTGYLMYSGAVSPSVSMGDGVTPRITSSSYVQEG